MKRRDFLGATALSLPLLAGCVDAPTPDERDGTGQLEYAVSDAAVTPDVEGDSDTDAWGILLASEAIAREYFGDVDGSEEVMPFVEATEFEAGDRLVYVQAFAPETCYRLALANEPVVEEGGQPILAMEAKRTAPAADPCGEAITPVELLVRLSFATDAPPAETVIVRIDGTVGTGREQIRLDAER